VLNKRERDLNGQVDERNLSSVIKA